MEKYDDQPWGVPYFHAEAQKKYDVASWICPETSFGMLDAAPMATAQRHGRTLLAEASGA